MIEKIESLGSKDGWQKPWFTEGTLSWPKNLSGRGNDLSISVTKVRTFYDMGCLFIPQIRNCCDKMPVWLIPIILLSLAVMMVSYFS